MARKGKGSLEFQQKLVLNQWLLGLFRAESLEKLAKHLKDERLEGYDGENVSVFVEKSLTVFQRIAAYDGRSAGA